MKKNIRDRILTILVEPATVTELKTKLKDVESFGTIAYHLSKLESDSIVTKRKDESKRGCPTTYSLIDKNLIEVMRERRRNSIMGRIEVLRKVKEKDFIEDAELASILERSEIPEDDIGYVIEEIFGCSNNKLTTMHFKITPRGLKFLEEHSK